MPADGRHSYAYANVDYMIMQHRCGVKTRAVHDPAPSLDHELQAVKLRYKQGDFFLYIVQ